MRKTETEKKQEKKLVEMYAEALRAAFHRAGIIIREINKTPLGKEAAAQLGPSYLDYMVAHEAVHYFGDGAFIACDGTPGPAQAETPYYRKQIEKQLKRAFRRPVCKPCRALRAAVDREELR